MIYQKKEILKRYFQKEAEPVSDSSSPCSDFCVDDGAVDEWWRRSASTKATPPPKPCSTSCSTFDNYPRAFSSLKSNYHSSKAETQSSSFDCNNNQLCFFQSENSIEQEMEMICQKVESQVKKEPGTFPPFHGQKLSTEIQGRVLNLNRKL